MKVLELFAGTRSIGKAFENRGHQVFSVEWDKNFENIDLYADILTVTTDEILNRFGRPDVIWASPDCSTFSIAAISHHRRKNPVTGNLDPVSDYAKFCDMVDQHVLQLIKDIKPRFWFIENPRGGMRKMSWMQGFPRYTVTYCQYGDTRMKPTDIWTNHPEPKFKPMCKNGDPCHERAPRSATIRAMKAKGIEMEVGGTQYGLKNSRERSIIPKALCQHIVDICEEGLSKEVP
jgi:site-specific DNA-cytosine methylase|nr:MAG TPA: DNA (cytosine 5) methyltransferase [Caudoviricetes sp.]